MNSSFPFSRKDIISGLFWLAMSTIFLPGLKFIWGLAIAGVTSASSFAERAYYQAIGVNLSVSFIADYFIIVSFLTGGCVLLIRLDKIYREMDKDKSLAIERRESRIRQRLKIKNILKYFRPIYGIVFIAATLFILTTYFVSLAVEQENLNFNWKVTIIAPHVPDQQLKELRSDWAKMQTEEEYDGINLNIRSTFVELVRANRLDSALLERVAQSD